MDGQLLNLKGLSKNLLLFFLTLHFTIVDIVYALQILKQIIFPCYYNW